MARQRREVYHERIRTIGNFAGILFLLLLPGIATGVEPKLVSDEMREFPGLQERLFERTISVDDRASMITVIYSSNVPLEMRVSFPASSEEGGMSYNPLLTLRYPGLPAGEMQEATLPLTESPAWDPWRRGYLLHVFGQEGASVQIHSIERAEPTTADTLGAAFKHLSVGEPVLLSSINYLWGYRILGISFSVLLGLIFLMVFGEHLVRKIKFLIPHPKTVLILSAFFLLLYDARFSADLLSISAKDLSEWTEEKEYRQLGPTVKIVDRLKEERALLANEMKVGLCFPWDDIYAKQIRYRLYPTPVRRMRDMDDATHLVFLGAEPLTLNDGSIACDNGEHSFEADEIAAFGQGSALYRVKLP